MSITTVRRPSFTGGVVFNDAQGAVGDTGETVMTMKLKAKEAFQSDILADIPAGTPFTVMEVGTAVPGRIRVAISATNSAGWISKATDKGQALVKWTGKARRTSERNLLPGTIVEGQNYGALQEGDVCEAAVQMTLRESADFKSNAVGTMQAGAQFTIAEVGGANRVKIMVKGCVDTVEAGGVGWVSSHTDTGQPLCKKIRARRTSLNLTKHLAVPLSGQADKKAAEPIPLGRRPSFIASQRQVSEEDAAQQAPALTPAPPPQEAPKAPPAPSKPTKGPWFMQLLCCSS